MISDEFSPGLLALVPTRKAHWPSNTAVEKLNRKDLDGFLNDAKNDRHTFIKEAARKVDQVMPLFEGKSCEAVLKIEQVGVEEFENIEDQSAILLLLDSV
ncbi:hypothetical protein LTR41_012247 [Exophiala xenobiotica]|nr:hypothetical protein LTR41_012247 [Exophiala xenobiotica]KAK5534249.1 hypothetical protein LTR46_012168 [Exophiala xenobiotica]